MPELLSMVFPFTIILATLSTYIGLARNQELTILRSGAFSGIQLVAIPFVWALAVGAVGIVAFDPVFAQANRKYEQLEATYLSNSRGQLSVSRNGIWLRQEDQAGIIVAQAQAYSASGGYLQDVELHQYDPQNRLTTRVEAATARIDEGFWILNQTTVWEYSGGAEPRLDVSTLEEYRIPTAIEFSQLSAYDSPNAVSVLQMPEIIRQHAAAGFSTAPFIAQLHGKISEPFFLGLMAILGAAFIQGYTRSSQNGLKAILAILIGFFLFALRSFAQSLGTAEQMPALISAWAVPLAGILVMTGVVLQLEDL